MQLVPQAQAICSVYSVVYTKKNIVNSSLGICICMWPVPMRTVCTWTGLCDGFLSLHVCPNGLVSGNRAIKAQSTYGHSVQRQTLPFSLYRCIHIHTRMYSIVTISCNNSEIQINIQAQFKSMKVQLQGVCYDLYNRLLGSEEAGKSTWYLAKAEQRDIQKKHRKRKREPEMKGRSCRLPKQHQQVTYY